MMMKSYTVNVVFDNIRVVDIRSRTCKCRRDYIPLTTTVTRMFIRLPLARRCGAATPPSHSLVDEERPPPPQRRTTELSVVLRCVHEDVGDTTENNGHLSHSSDAVFDHIARVSSWKLQNSAKNRTSSFSRTTNWGDKTRTDHELDLHAMLRLPLVVLNRSRRNKLKTAEQSSQSRRQKTAQHNAYNDTMSRNCASQIFPYIEGTTHIGK